MGSVVLCRHLPCLLRPVIHVNEPLSGWDRATPFLIGIMILLVSIATTRAVIEKAEERMTRGWTPSKLQETGVAPPESPHTHILGLTWVADVAQIPALLGTPLVGLFILKHHIVILLYTGVLAAGLIVFFCFYLMKEIGDYERYSKTYHGFRFTVITGGAILVNLVCAAIAYAK